MSGAGAHPAGSDDTVAQTSNCEIGQSRLKNHKLRSPSPAATGQIDAVLIASTTRAPIAGGKVVLTGLDTCGDTIHRHLSTGANGQVSFRGLQTGRYQVTAYPGAMRAQSTADVDLPTPTLKTLQFTVSTSHG
ncbi:carboxypeptidase-like regulatory domain-containing protein [Nocardia sp. NPDC058497]|uniref:carboxypeptidase-like regulatory domain-containing protein n=1 Tax=Nocardia sp. NPDC058497 TaxID=3346529 RepID=UPI003657D960